jgi:FdhE protein
MLHGIVALWQGTVVQRIQSPDVDGPSALARTNGLRLPLRRDVFSVRAARLRHLSRGSVMRNYLGMMADLAGAQQRVLDGFEGPPLARDRIALAEAHDMPPLQAPGGIRDPVWRFVLDELLVELSRVRRQPAEVRDIGSELRDAVRTRPAWLETAADALLAGREVDIDSAAVPFVMGALQVYWTDQACRLESGTRHVAHLDGLCPLCGCQPVAGILRGAAPSGQERYLACSLCGSQWVIGHTGCTRCDITGETAYWQDDDLPASVNAQVCDICRTYRKFFDEDLDSGVEPVADDLASLLFDVRLAEEGYRRSGVNMLLWEEALHG